MTATFDFATISGIITGENKTGSKRKDPRVTGRFGAPDHTTWRCDLER